jgi:hypothetical protein
VKGVETELEAKAGILVGDELAALDAKVQAWAASEFKSHPAWAAFLEAVKPPAPVTFTLSDAQMAAVQAALVDGTLNAKLGLAS